MNSITHISDKYLAFRGMASSRIPHWEMWSCPDAETFLTGIDYYDHPRQCRSKMAEQYPDLDLPIFETDEPRKRPDFETTIGEDGHTYQRWGDGRTDLFAWGDGFKTEEDIFNFSPLENADYRLRLVGERWDYRDEEKLCLDMRKGWRFPLEEGERGREGDDRWASFYNTAFMWPLLMFGWDLFLETCLDPRFERIMDEFAEINRRAFRCLARFPVNFIVTHDDIVTAQGPICPPWWMRKYIYPRYEELFGILRDCGKQVIFMADGKIDACIDNVMACGASGVYTEPYTDFKAIARKHKNCVLAGEGDNRILKQNDPARIRIMVENMVETSRMTGGYLMGIGNHITWDLPPQAVKLYFDLSAELARR
ncbi:MAG: uroporphyrinogen decarboxylase family protein [bacterium]|nr:hypothetical protein [Candidatus Sumerlaeota bacterium]